MMRFWSKVDRTSGHGPEGDCWIWTASKMPAGYGRFCASKAERWWELAHRFSWFLVHGPIPKGVFICHRCDNPSCVNPAHLFAGSHGDNMRDMATKGRAAKRCPVDRSEGSKRGYAAHSEKWKRGPGHHNAKLDEEKVREIRQLWADGQSQQSIAGEYGLSQANVSSIVRRAAWKHVA